MGVSATVTNYALNCQNLFKMICIICLADKPFNPTIYDKMYFSLYMSRNMRFPTMWYVRPA